MILHGTYMDFQKSMLILQWVFEDFQKKRQFYDEFLTITLRIFDRVVTDFQKMKDVPSKITIFTLKIRPLHLPKKWFRSGGIQSNIYD